MPRLFLLLLMVCLSLVTPISAADSNGIPVKNTVANAPVPMANVGQTIDAIDADEEIARVTPGETRDEVSSVESSIFLNRYFNHAFWCLQLKNKLSFGVFFLLFVTITKPSNLNSNDRLQNALLWCVQSCTLYLQEW